MADGADAAAEEERVGGQQDGDGADEEDGESAPAAEPADAAGRGVGRRRPRRRPQRVRGQAGGHDQRRRAPRVRRVAPERPLALPSARTDSQKHPSSKINLKKNQRFQRLRGHEPVDDAAVSAEGAGNVVTHHVHPKEGGQVGPGIHFQTKKLGKTR